MEKNFTQLAEVIQSRSKLPILSWEARLVAQKLVKQVILDNPKINAIIDEAISEKNFPQIRLRQLRNEIKKSRQPSVVKTSKLVLA